MPDSTPLFDLWSVWRSLSIINQGFVLLFSAGAIYSLALSVYVLFVLPGPTKKATGTGAGTTAHCVLRKRLWNLRQFHLAGLYLLGFCIMFQIPGVFHMVANSYDLPPMTVYRTLSFLCYFDATIFFAFLLIHGLQWFVSNRLRFDSK